MQRERRNSAFSSWMQAEWRLLDLEGDVLDNALALDFENSGFAGLEAGEILPQVGGVADRLSVQCADDVSLLQVGERCRFAVEKSGDEDTGFGAGLQAVAEGAFEIYAEDAE